MKNRIEEQQMQGLLKWLNVRLGPSEIHGIGVFALKDMPEGHKLHADNQPFPFHLPVKKLKNQLPEDLYNYILGMYPRVVKNEPFVFPNAQFTAYMNHSDNPNYDAKTDTLLRSVEKGEEITEDYRQIEGWEEVYEFLM